MDEERWLPVVGYAEHYEISDHGRLRRLHPVRGKVPQLLRHTANHDGYPTVSLCVNARARKHRVHLLVWTTFVGPVPDGYLVHHHDDDKTNPVLANLRLMTYGDHVRYHHGLRRWARNWEHCRRCGRTTVAHNAHGFCITCYHREHRHERARNAR